MNPIGYNVPPPKGHDYRPTQRTGQQIYQNVALKYGEDAATVAFRAAGVGRYENCNVTPEQRREIRTVARRVTEFSTTAARRDGAPLVFRKKLIAKYGAPATEKAFADAGIDLEGASKYRLLTDARREEIELRAYDNTRRIENVLLRERSDDTEPLHNFFRKKGDCYLDEAGHVQQYMPVDGEKCPPAIANALKNVKPTRAKFYRSAVFVFGEAVAEGLVQNLAKQSIGKFLNSKKPLIFDLNADYLGKNNGIECFPVAAQVNVADYRVNRVAINSRVDDLNAKFGITNIPYRRALKENCYDLAERHPYFTKAEFSERTVDEIIDQSKPRALSPTITKWLSLSKFLPRDLMSLMATILFKTELQQRNS